MAQPVLPAPGGCRCGQLRFVLTAAPMLAAICHCRGCQRMTASAYSLSVTVAPEGFAVTAGEAVAGGVGGPVRHHHCPTCKSWVHTLPPVGGPAFVNVRATMLDDPAWFFPFVEFQTAEMLPWATTPAVRRFERFPDLDQFGALVADYQRWAAAQ